MLDNGLAAQATRISLPNAGLLFADVTPIYSLGYEFRITCFKSQHLLPHLFRSIVQTPPTQTQLQRFVVDRTGSSTVAIDGPYATVGTREIDRSKTCMKARI